MAICAVDLRVSRIRYTHEYIEQSPFGMFAFGANSGEMLAQNLRPIQMVACLDNNVRSASRTPV